MRWIAFVSLVSGLVAGCTAGDEPSENEEAVFDPLIEAVDRAEEVQQTVEEQAEELRRRIEEAEGRAQ